MSLKKYFFCFWHLSNLNAGNGKPCAGQRRLNCLPWVLVKVKLSVPSENLGLELPMGSDQNKHVTHWYRVWPEHWQWGPLCWAKERYRRSWAQSKCGALWFLREFWLGAANGLWKSFLSCSYFSNFSKESIFCCWDGGSLTFKGPLMKYFKTSEYWIGYSDKEINTIKKL